MGNLPNLPDHHSKEAVFVLGEIMKISERQLEDWICEHPDSLGGPHINLIGRQIPLVHGILDILAFDCRVLVVELKARDLKEEDLTQVLRYAHDVDRFTETIMERIVCHLSDDAGPLEQEIFKDNFDRYMGLTQWGYNGPQVVPMLIGTGINKNTLIACNGVGIEVGIWKYDDNSFTIKIPDPDPIEYRQLRAPDWLKQLVEIIGDHCVNLTSAMYDRKMNELFGIKD